MDEKRAAAHALTREFQIVRYECFDYGFLKSVVGADQARGRRKDRLNNLFIMADTETSKSAPDRWEVRNHKREYLDNENYIVKWSVAINTAGINVAALWGDDPEELIDCITRIHAALPGDTTIIYIHNLAYDYVFLRKFFLAAWGAPVKQLNTKPHYPVEIGYFNGIVFRDSLIIAQRSIEKWAKDLNVEHQKAVGSWDYDKIRHQRDELTEEEQIYIVNDVLAGVECLQATRKAIRKTYRGFPYTATGIPRSELREVSKLHHAHQWVKENYEWEPYTINEWMYHGGYVHMSRWRAGDIVPAIAFDFASSYPYVLLAYPFPYEKWARLPFDPSPEWIRSRSDDEAFMFEASFRNVRLKDPFFPMPVLQLSKVTMVMDAVADNGRIREAGFCSLWMNEITLDLISRIYEWDELELNDCWFSAKRYLPDWIAGYIYKLFRDKTVLKGGDPVQYAIAKAKLNSIYGMMVQKIVRDEITEDPVTGDYEIADNHDEEHFLKAISNQNLFLWYSVGVWCTSYAQRNLFRLGSCAAGPDSWLYSDTDSCYFEHCDQEKVEAYNREVRERLSARGFGAVEHNGREYWLGVAEKDGEYSEFRGWHSKCYAVRDAETGKLKITVAGVPKKGVACLEDDIRNFKPGFIFQGEKTGKLTHMYHYAIEIHRNSYGDLIGDSINLIPCDYEVSPSIEKKIQQALNGMEVSVPYYGDDAVL